MSKFCPIVGKKIVYLECQECTDRVCENPKITILPKKEKPAHDTENDQEVVVEVAQKSNVEKGECEATHPSCETCCHKCGEHRETMFGKTFNSVNCKIFHNRIFTSAMVAEQGCDYHNRDVSQEEICMNCEHYLGGGDWGLACKADYHKLPSSTTEACEKFKRKREDEDNA